MQNYMANINGDEPVSLMAKVCSECPWRKVDKVGSYVPSMPDKIIEGVAKTGMRMACHMSQKEIQAFAGSVMRCRGIEHFRANIGVESEVEPDRDIVLSDEEEALSFWPPQDNNPWSWELLRKEYFRKYPLGDFTDEQGRLWIAGKLKDV